MVTKAAAATTPAIGFSLSFNLDGSRENHNNLVVQFHLPFQFTKAELDEHVDKVFDVVERRKNHFRLEVLQGELEANEAFIVNAKADLERIHNQNQEAHIASGRQGKYKPSQKDGQQIINARNNVQNAEASVKKIKARIKVIGDKLGLNVSTNRRSGE